MVYLKTMVEDELLCTGLIEMHELDFPGRIGTPTPLQGPTKKHIGLRQGVINTRLDLDEDHLSNPIQEEKNMIKKHEL